LGNVLSRATHGYEKLRKRNLHSGFSAFRNKKVNNVDTHESKELYEKRMSLQSQIDSYNKD